MDRIEQQLTLWDSMYPKKRITKPIRLIELFDGIGSQFKALKQITKNAESWKICEWAYNSYCSYNAIHIKDNTDYSVGKTKDELIAKVRGTSTNYNEPLTDKQLEKKSLEWLKNAYNNIVATRNLVNIMNVHGKDLEIAETDKYEYIMTYSFPCQDLSLAGKRQGMSTSQKDGGTRSGLLWEVERILTELYIESREREESTLPQILLMENVPQVICPDFTKWQLKLESLGYKNYVEVMNASHYGIPQNRKRCFMISILGEYSYSFPLKIKLKYKLKDMLEDSVPEKYYLSKKMIDFFTFNSQKQKEKGNGFNFSPNEGQGNAKAITTRNGSRMDDNFVLIKNATKQGYLEATNGDGIDISTRMQYHRGNVQKGMAQTLTTMGGENVGVAVKDTTVIGGIGEKKSNGGTQYYMQDRIYEGEIVNSIATSFNPWYKTDLRIRKLTPKECTRLMGFEDIDYESMKSIGMTDSAIYHMCGDSIVVPNLIAIFSQLFEEDKHIEIINNYIDTIKNEGE